MFFTFVILALISFFDLRRIYKNNTKGKAVIATLFFIGVLAVCMITAGGFQLRSLIVIVGDLMKQIGLAYPPLQ
jgi:hypothetical protein